MAPHRAQLNMNKPSSADTPAKPNSACRHHCRTEQEAPDPLLACTNELQWLRRHAIKSLFQSQLPIKRNIMALNNPAVVFFFFLSPFLPSHPRSLLWQEMQSRSLRAERTWGNASAVGFRGDSGGETGFLESSCLFSEGSLLVTVIGFDVCLVAAAAAAALRAAGQMPKRQEFFKFGKI